MKQSTELMQLKLETNFKLGEFYVSGKHPTVARAMEILPAHIASLTRLCCTLLQPMRDWLGHALVVNNGVRADQLNLLVGGSDTSQHKRAEAADTDLKGYEAWDMFEKLLTEKAEEVGQCIIYLTMNKIPHFLHVSIPTLGTPIKPTGDFRVKLDGDDNYYRWGAEPIPGVKSPVPDAPPESEPIEDTEPVEDQDDNNDAGTGDELDIE